MCGATGAKGGSTWRRRWRRRPALDPATAGRDRARALYGAGALALEQGDPLAARDLLEQSLTLARECGDRLTVARALRSLGNTVRYGHGDFAAARDSVRAVPGPQSGSWVIESRTSRWRSIVLGHLALAGGGLRGRARAACGRPYPVPRAGGPAEYRGRARRPGLVGRRTRGITAAARALLEQSLALLRELGDKAFIAEMIVRPGQRAYVAGRLRGGPRPSRAEPGPEPGSGWS